jgi:hypothetical protein
MGAQNALSNGVTSSAWRSRREARGAPHDSDEARRVILALDVS